MSIKNVQLLFELKPSVQTLYTLRIMSRLLISDKGLGLKFLACSIIVHCICIETSGVNCIHFLTGKRYA